MPKLKSPAPAAGLAAELPKHVKLSEHERALVARLVRVMRGNGYFLKIYIEWLLHMDAAGKYNVSLSEAEAALTVMRNFENWNNYITGLPKDCEAIKDYPGLRWIRTDLDDDENETDGVTGAAVKGIAETLTLEDQLRAELEEIKRRLSPQTPTDDPRRHYARAIAARIGETLANNDD